jgi:hypothetical protein
MLQACALLLSFPFRPLLRYLSVMLQQDVGAQMPGRFGVDLTGNHRFRAFLTAGALFAEQRNTDVCVVARRRQAAPGD